MAVTELGKVTVTPKGAWSASTSYERLDIVSNNGGSYIAKRAVPAGTALTNTTYWLQIAEKGEPGSGSATDHTQLLNRDAADQHPMSAITGLTSALDGKQDEISDLESIRTGAGKGDTAVQPSALNSYRTASDQDEIDDGLQPALTVGEGISIEDDTISAIGYKLAPAPIVWLDWQNSYVYIHASLPDTAPDGAVLKAYEMMIGGSQSDITSSITGSTGHAQMIAYPIRFVVTAPGFQPYEYTTQFAK